MQKFISLFLSIDNKTSEKENILSNDLLFLNSLRRTLFVVLHPVNPKIITHSNSKLYFFFILMILVIYF